MSFADSITPFLQEIIYIYVNKINNNIIYFKLNECLLFIMICSLN